MNNRMGEKLAFLGGDANIRLPLFNMLYFHSIGDESYAYNSRR
jgi:hypothetical protein